ncbi:dTMP kinase [Streptomyces tubercidicus]|uniref:dTMP kinase n=1 Tax=Streptomyces tubercidicus TaxID=47759 RepID=UPI002E11BED1|nr:thymidylate kinase [Streptomyces tubercidicus]WSX23677.1 thymidylate kinase [Streptomyces tubercidicus]
MLIVLEGIDGSGKSTVARLVARELDPGRTAPAGKKDIAAADPGTAARADLLRELIWSSPEEQGDTYGAAHWILLIASWYAGLARLRPELADGETVTVMDGWYYRNIAKTLVREPLDAHWVESLFAPVPEPALTVLLDVAPEVAWSRRDGFKDTETGRWDGFTGPPRESFCGYQSLVRRELLRMAAERGWSVLTPDPDDPPEQIAAAVVAAAHARRRTP